MSFDPRAVDAGRLIYGQDAPEVIIRDVEVELAIPDQLAAHGTPLHSLTNDEVSTALETATGEVLETF
ncbi:hypothetical protein CCICO_08405 [Corynebacterium ciconiae DSM 44920]|uniref:hypothetical protein n=1 Tax=Corynebacterium ciconiae TaxID=227319 RepID=UPI000361E41D|nr:hypothetical protein [Corynebacterium ciconiae]WKD61694.1 hypothetical protein CCICO_08405 [Corynebacterium ciconiae DSM 44920]